MKALTDKIIEILQDKHDKFIGCQKDKEAQAENRGYKLGLLTAIETISCIEKSADFEEISRVLMKHLGNGELYHPHCTVIISNSRVELVEGIKANVINDYVPD